MGRKLQCPTQQKDGVTAPTCTTTTITLEPCALNVLKFPFFAISLKEGIGSGNRPKDRVTFWITPVHKKQKGDQNWVLSPKAITALQPLKDDHPGIL